MAINIYEHVTPQAALEGAVSITKWTKAKEATLEKFSSNIIKATQDAIINEHADLVREAVKEAYDQHVELHGERDMAEMLGSNADDWDSQLDDALEAIVEPYQPDLSADWLATATTGGSAGLHEDNGVEKFCQSFGKEIWKQACYGKTPPQILAAIGIVDQDTIKQWFEYGKGVGTSGAAIEASAEQNASELDEIVAKLAGLVIAEADMNDALDMVMDDDDILAAGAADRLGIGEVEIATLRDAKATHSPSSIIDMVNDARSGVSSAAPEKAPKGNETPPPPKGDAIPAEVLMALKNHSAVQDGALAEALGISRGSLGNYQKGKSEFLPSLVQRKVLEDRLIADMEGLGRAYMALTGETYSVR